MSFRAALQFHCYSAFHQKSTLWRHGQRLFNKLNSATQTNARLLFPSLTQFSTLFADKDKWDGAVTSRVRSDDRLESNAAGNPSNAVNFDLVPMILSSGASSRDDCVVFFFHQSEAPIKQQQLKGFCVSTVWGNLRQARWLLIGFVVEFFVMIDDVCLMA